MKKQNIFNIMIYILMFIALLSIIIIKPINDLDEIWNYNFARNVANGLVPYRDFNMLQMPLLPIICSIFLKFITNKLVIIRILAAFLCSGIIFVIYKLFGLLNIKKEIGIIFCFIIGYLFVDCFCIDYNFATLLIVLLMIYIEIKLYKKDNNFIKVIPSSELILGILAGLTVTLKQTTGLLVCVALLGNKLLFVREKNQFKIYLKSFLYRLVGILIPIALMLIYLILNNAFGDFISYTIKGISGFSNYISYKNLIKFNIIGGFAILVPLTFFYQWYSTIIMERNKEKYILLVYGLAIFVVAFPISNKIHFLIGSTPTIILILYSLYNLLYRLYNKLNKLKKSIIIISYLMYAFIILFTVCYSGRNLYKYLNNRDKFSKLSSYNYISINKNLENQIINIGNYILTSKENVKILDATAAIYMIPIDKYNKDYDMLLKGNLGENGEEILIKDIEQSKDTKYLVLKDEYSKNWQTPLNIIKYVTNNKTKTGEIEIFNIYE